MRLFVAAYPPPPVRDHLQERLAGLQISIAAARGVNTRAARPDTWHITLVFLGEVPEERAADVTVAIQRAIGRWQAAGPGVPTLRLASGGRFGRGRYTVLWVGVAGDREPLEQLSRQVRRELKRDRLPYDDRPFKAHLTIARPGDRLDRAAVDADRAALAEYRGPQWALETVTLVRSHLGPRPRYDHLAQWPLV
jgi:2'-5' RNA ligase